MLCTECRAPTVWDDEAASEICIACGTLVDGSQSLLVSTGDPTFHSAPPSALKSFRLGQNWDLPGQGKEAREKKNSFAIAEYISSLAASLNASALAPRAITLFTQTRSLQNFRWGRQAKLVGGACLAIALRESHRPDALHDIAFLLTESFPALVRTLFSVTSLLNIRLIPSDPRFHIPDLLNFLSDLVSNESPIESDLPISLVSRLRLLSFRSAENTATSLCNFITRRGPDHRVNQLPSPPTACAVLLLALEAEARTPLTNIIRLARCLGARYHVGESAVMDRYKTLQDEMSACIERVPWLTKYERTQGKHANRAKVGKRAIVARGLRDVVQFQEQIWRGQPKPSLVDISDDDGLDASGRPNTDRTLQQARLIRTEPLPVHSPKRRKRKHEPVLAAAQFLLNPLSSPIPSATSSQMSDLSQCHTLTMNHPKPLFTHRQHHRRSSLSVASYILNAPCLANSISSMQQPTRLQILSAERGSGSEDVIADDELFAPGELEGLLRGDREADEIREQYIKLGIWDETEAEHSEEVATRTNVDAKNRKKRRKGEAAEPSPRSKLSSSSLQKRRGRINFDALARFLQEPNHLPLATTYQEGDDANGTVFLGLENFDNDGQELEDEDEYDDSKWSDTQATGLAAFDDDAIIVDHWRSLSPSPGSSFQAEGYEEEYD